MIWSLFTFAIAGAGVAAFMLLGLPLPWLLGPITACLLAALIGVPLRGIRIVNESMRTILGVAVGATFTPALLLAMMGYWPTLLLIPVMTALIGLLGVPYFHRLWGYDFATSYYGSMPGGLQDMLAFGEEAGANVRALSLIQATRVLFIVVALPFILQSVWDADLSNPPGLPVTAVDPVQLLVMLACAVIGWRVAKRVGMFGSSILGPLILAAVAALSGVDGGRQICGRHRTGNPPRPDGGVRVLLDPFGADCVVHRSHLRRRPRPTYGDFAGLCPRRAGRVDGAGVDCRRRHGLCHRASCVADVSGYFRWAALCAAVCEGRSLTALPRDVASVAQFM